jgi:hypothetical protein
VTSLYLSDSHTRIWGWFGPRVEAIGLDYAVSSSSRYIDLAIEAMKGNRQPGTQTE